MRPVYAFVTAYHPSEVVVQNMQALSSQVSRLVITDNSAESNADMFRMIPNAVYLPNHQNLGISQGFNKAIRSCGIEFSDEDFLIFFDQDSRIEEGYIFALAEEYEAVEKKFPNLGCLGPVFYNTSNAMVETPRLKTFLTSRTCRVNNIITSSLLARYGKMKEVGFWNEKIFLDMSDWDLCWRMEEAGMICAITDKVTLRHSVGSGQKKVGPIHLRVGAPFREYYQSRDARYLLDEKYVPFKMRIRLWMTIHIRPILHNMFLENKEERKAYRKRGKEDYQKGVTGEYRPPN